MNVGCGMGIEITSQITKEPDFIKIKIITEIHFGGSLYCLPKSYIRSVLEYVSTDSQIVIWKNYERTNDIVKERI
jgi:hypothetical protein